MATPSAGLRTFHVKLLGPGPTPKYRVVRLFRVKPPFGISPRPGWRYIEIGLSPGKCPNRHNALKLLSGNNIQIIDGENHRDREPEGWRR